MQAASGSRGVQVYTSADIDNDIAVAEYINATTADYLPDRQLDFFVTFLGVNLRDQIRKDKEETPLQFTYDAANCRIFYTPDTWSDYTSLWTYAVNAISSPKLCVSGSTGFASNGVGSAAAAPPPISKASEQSAYSLLGTTIQFTNGFTGPELGSCFPKAKGKAVVRSKKCNSKIPLHQNFRMSASAILICKSRLFPPSLQKQKVHYCWQGSSWIHL